MSTIQSILFEKSKYTKAESDAFIGKYLFHPIKYSNENMYHHYRLHNPSKFKNHYYVTEKIRPGILLRIAYPRH